MPPGLEESKSPLRIPKLQQVLEWLALLLDAHIQSLYRQPGALQVCPLCPLCFHAAQFQSLYCQLGSLLTSHQDMLFVLYMAKMLTSTCQAASLDQYVFFLFISTSLSWTCFLHSGNLPITISCLCCTSWVSLLMMNSCNGCRTAANDSISACHMNANMFCQCTLDHPMVAYITCEVTSDMPFAQKCDLAK